MHKIAVIGAGAIGRTHLETLRRTKAGLELSAIVDPNPEAAKLADLYSAAWFSDIDQMLDIQDIDAAIVASPNELHVPQAKLLMEAGKPLLLEKPVANTVDETMILLNAQASLKVPILVGHHRRHNPIINAAHQAIRAGVIGQLAIANVMYSLHKNDDYFAAPWRTRVGVGGPILINLIHEIDLLRYFFGEIVNVSSFKGNVRRASAVEDTAVAIVEFAEGGYAALAVSDTSVGPWSWDLASGENQKRFPRHDAYSHMFAGTSGGLSLPDLSFWSYDGSPSWETPMSRRQLDYSPEDPYENQLLHFAEVVAGRTEPVVSVVDAARNMCVIDAIIASSKSGKREPVRSIEG